jgi:amidase
MDYWTLDATAQADLIRRREIQPLELVDAVIQRIEALNPSINAVVSPLFDKARTAARQKENPDAPFFGVPLLLKDFLCETAGDPYYCGAKLLRDIDWHSKRDSYLAQRFRQAGFIFVGKTNLPEFAGSAITKCEAFGATRNPWNLDHTSDGSSGGSAAAVASGMVAVAHGNDGLGSIRGPASACGLVGLKPSRGRLPTGPAWQAGFFGNIVEFVLTKSVRDTATILDAVHGAASGNIFKAPQPNHPYRDELTAPFRPYRFGIMTHDTILNLPVHPDCQHAVEQAGALLEAQGHTVEYAFPPQLETGATGLGLALRIVLATGFTALLNRWAETIGREINEQDVEPETWASAQLGKDYTGVQVQEAYHRLANGACRVVEWWDTGYDFLITPVRTQPPPKLGLSDPDQLTAAFGFFTMPYSLSGQPAIAIPIHVTDSGLPVGVQIVADYGREDLLLQIATQLERANPWVDKLPYAAFG